ncbi:methylmalonyl-CoA mutase family protein [Winogradskyella echinorum]|uniref:Fused isobutyryl-CoA mutase n=1 Tax=Winogradskyella echinorum TaxID=538189 RepID=A0ABR6XWM9_9FLAO|nr:methylmalonyl-CoA mutase family protein [Winogradskyella echinorum]MBC3844897.1 methylmalonyl-CoA mutase family protein [Winogradskyella echinorum]MBC5749245.1 methylmalonyl-CoA mutase family protein [Winogradskyella echinorum]
MEQVAPYKPKYKVRIVTAASLFDGHDAAINIMRRIIQSTGVEVIHLGHDRSVEEVVNTAIQEDANAIAMTSYQGGHNEYFKYMYDLLKEKGAGHIKIFGGGGGVILPEEIKELMDYGITRIYSPDDGRELGLQGMINDLVEKSDYQSPSLVLPKEKEITQSLKDKDVNTIARLISFAENQHDKFEDLFSSLSKSSSPLGKLEGACPVLGITGTGGAGKSSLVDELVRRFLIDFPEKTIGLISVDPSKRKTGGALLGDRIRMNAINSPRVYMRSLATRQSNLALSKYVNEAIEVLKAAEYDLIILETSGIGQSDTEIIEHSDVALYVMTPEFGAATQLEKIDMLDFADLVAINKFDKRGSLDALRDVKKQYMRNNNLWDIPQDQLPVYGTIASQFNDPGMNTLYKAIMDKLVEKADSQLKSTFEISKEMSEKIFVIPPSRTRYLSEIAENNRAYDKKANEQVEVAQKLYGIYKTICSVAVISNDNEKSHLNKFGIDQEEILKQVQNDNKDFVKLLIAEFDRVKLNLDPYNWEVITGWDEKVNKYKNPIYSFKVRDKEIKIETHTESLSHTQIPKVALPKYQAWGDILRWCLQENVPGEFPYTSGLYPFKRTGEDPARMFAGEGGPERTNKRFHYVSMGLPAKRLSTAFDSVTLYGNDPDLRPDIYGKIGNAGVSICCLDDAKKLYSGFDLANVMTSVSMTINGPAPMLLGFFMNAAIDQQCEIYIKENGLEKEVEAKIAKLYKGKERPKYNGELPEGNNGLGLMLLGVTGDQVLPADVYAEIKKNTIAQVRGTVQADILKEDQAQNTCIFSTEFALRLMGDVQEYFIENNVRNFYSVSISGYHIAEAGANPITQLALTLSNGFTYVEYYLSRGMDINKFGPNLSFFFSNGIDPEYAVIGRVARKIWAKAMKNKYGANARAQMLKYHIQTSGRSLHAQEIDFNDIRTTLQALYAIYDNCNSLHTNAYDEAITTPTEESVRRAMAIQLIINKELGLAKNENPIQGSFIIEELTDLVEEAVLIEFDRITERGGVLGAMETMYQRSKIQEESLYYETLKHNGQFPIIGVNTFLSSKGSPTVIPKEVIRATEEEKQFQIKILENLHKANDTEALLKDLQQKAVNNENIFEALMDVCKVCSLGQITSALFEVGGQYRRNM